MTYINQGIIDSLLDQLAVIDQDGLIIAVNKSWIDFSHENGGDLSTDGIGSNYLDVCQEKVRKGIEFVLNGQKDHFIFEYSCHSETEIRWFLLRATPPTINANRDLGAVVSHINITKQKLKLNQLERETYQLQKAVFIDELTGVNNRRFLNQILNDEYKKSIISKKHFSLLMIDIDNFKRYNDTYGHPKGDQCLSLVANTLFIHVGNIGFVCRIGGEEFCIVLPNTNNDQAISLANKLRYEVEELKVPHANSHTSPYITISIGVATTVADHPPQMDSSELLVLADQALYKAKEDGRNQVIN